MDSVHVGEVYRISTGRVVVVREVLLNQVRLARVQRGECGAGEWRPLSVLRDATPLDPDVPIYAQPTDWFGNDVRGGTRRR
jgi:hypothetical protein